VAQAGISDYRLLGVRGRAAAKQGRLREWRFGGQSFPQTAKRSRRRGQTSPPRILSLPRVRV